MDEDNRRNVQGRFLSKVNEIAALLTIVAMILAVLSIAVPWYHLTSSDEWPDYTYFRFDIKYYLLGQSTDGWRYDGWSDYKADTLANLMLTELVLIGCWAIAGTLSVATYLFRCRRMYLASALGTIVISILTITVFALFVADAVESSTGSSLEGFVGTAPGDTAYDYSYGPLIGWWITLAACAIQSASSLLSVGFGRRSSAL